MLPGIAQQFATQNLGLAVQVGNCVAKYCVKHMVRARTAVGDLVCRSCYTRDVIKVYSVSMLATFPLASGVTRLFKCRIVRNFVMDQTDIALSWRRPMLIVLPSLMQYSLHIDLWTHSVCISGTLSGPSIFFSPISHSGVTAHLIHEAVCHGTPRLSLQAKGEWCRKRRYLES